MLKNLRKRNEGFTIIEVLIVLAIAGLIMLVVFLAVPALQRSSRNNQAKNAASAVLAAANEFQDVNGGLMPTGLTISNGTITVSGATGTTPTVGKTQGGYDAGTVNTFPDKATVDPGRFFLGVNRKCNGNADFTTTNRALAVAYIAETANGEAPQCIES